MPGVIVTKNVERGSLAAAGTTAFTLEDTRVVKLDFGVPDSILGHLKLGSEVPVRLDALPGQTLSGRITEIAATANSDSRVFNVEVSFAEPRSFAQGGHDRQCPYSTLRFAGRASRSHDRPDDG